MQTQIVRGTATKIREEGGQTIVSYHKTDVVKFTKKVITLNSGGWKTATTKNRMVQASNQFGLGFSVFQKQGGWFVDPDTSDIMSEIVAFSDGMTIDRLTGEVVQG